MSVNYTLNAQDEISPDLQDGSDPGAISDAELPTGAGGDTGVEAPEALFELDIGDAEVDFFLEGTWRASIFGSFGILIDPEGELISSPFPGWGDGFAFQQLPDLTFSVWLLNRFFIEASVIGDFLEEDYTYFDQNYILMGYMGAEGEFLERLLIGSRDISIDPFPFIDVPESGLSSLGAEAVLGTGMSEHQLLLRYDNNEPDSLTFIGSNLVSEQVIALDEYIGGRFFKLPDADVDAGSLEVYLEDPDGGYSGDDGKTYRLATVDDAVLNSENGTVFLKEPAIGNVVVYYKKGVLGVGTDASMGGGALPDESGSLIDVGSALDFQWNVASLDNYFGQDMDVRQVTVNGKLGLRIFKPGEFSPFEILASYALDGTVPEDLARLRVSVVRKGNLSATVPTDVGFQFAPGADYIRGYYKPNPGLRADFRNLYPFLDDTETSPIFDPENLLYGPLADPKPGYLDYEILVSELTPVSGYRIGSDVVPGSVQILRNGISETRYEVNYQQGAITFLTEIAPDDRLVVSFRRKSSFANNGDILFAWGNTLTFGEALNLQLATGVRWNFLPGSYTDEAYTRTGSVVLSAGIDGTIGPLSYQATIGGAYTNPDTTGVMRLLGMESTGFEVALSENTAYPASPPNGDDPYELLSGLTHAARGELLYKDYRSYGILGASVLMPYTWDPPASQQYQYDQMNSKPGPYIAKGSSEGSSTDQSLVLDFDLALNEWVGVQLPALYGGAVADLSTAQGISVLYRTTDIDPSSAFTVYLQLGDIGEDLDEDGKLDEEFSESSSGFVFDEGKYGVDLKVGGGPKNEGNNRLDSEDIDGNGFLDGDDASPDPNIITLTVAAITDTTDWTAYSHTFAAGEKRRLARTRSLRLIVVRTAGSDSTGRLLLDEISLAGSRFFAGWYVDPDISSTDEVRVRELEEWELAVPPANTLEDTYSEVEEIFHPFGEQQKVLEISWNNGAGSQTWRAKGYTEAETEGIHYRNIVYYTHLPAIDGGVLRFSLSDATGKGIRWSYPPFATTKWEKIVVSIEDGKIYHDGIELTGPDVDVTVAGGYDSLGIFTVELTDADTGTLYLDELHLTDPEGAVGAGATLDLELSLPGELVSWGGHAFVHDLSFRESAAYASKGFSTLYGTPLGAQSFSSMSELDVGISLADLSIDFTVAATDSLITLGGGHGITLPNVAFPVVFSDSFSLRTRETGEEFQRENTLSLRAPPLLQLDLQTQAGSLEDTLSQSWDADLRITPNPVTLQNSLAVSGAVSGFSLPVNGYFNNWIYGYSLLAPWQEGTEVERRADLILDWGVNTSPVGAESLWSHGFHGYDLSAPSRTLNSSAAMELAIPILWQEEGITRLSVKPGYRRNLKIISLETGLGDYASDFSMSFQRIYSQRYFYSQVPYAELYSLEAEQRFLDLSADLEEATYSAEAYLQLSRRFSSRIRDLFLPSFLELGFQKQFIKDEDLTDLFNTYNLKAQSTALNLFGDFGAYPLFPFYRTDEFSTALSLSLDVDGQTVTKESARPALGMILDHYLSFEGEADNALTIENRFNLQYDKAVEAALLEKYGTKVTWGDTVKFLYTWYRYPETGVKLPLLPVKIGEQGYWSHLESLELEMKGPTEESSYHPLNVILSHESSAVLPDYGEISAEISAGFDVEQTEAQDRYWRFGLRGGIAVQIEF